MRMARVKLFCFCFCVFLCLLTSCVVAAWSCRTRKIIAYVRSVVDRLVPPEVAGAVSFRFYIARDPMVNAFALPNGSIYLNVGLLARLENEAQLAHVLSHEIAHVVQRHSLQQLRNRRPTVVAANVADLLLFGTSIAYLPAIGALASHSRESEAEADRAALEYMSRAGYPLEEADQLFKLLQEVKQKESAWGSVYSSHPDNTQRAQATREILASGRLPTNAGGANRANEYLALRDALILEKVRLNFFFCLFFLVAVAVVGALAKSQNPSWLHYYRGKAKQKKTKDPTGTAQENTKNKDKKVHR